MIITIIKDYIKEFNKIERVYYGIIFTIFSVILAVLFPNITDNYIATLITAYSIFIGFLFNLIIILSNLAKDIPIIKNSPKSDIDIKRLKLNVIERGLKIISASILIAVVNIIFMLLQVLDWEMILKLIDKYLQVFIIIKNFFIFLTYFCTIIFIHSLYSILNIAHILLQKEITFKNKEIDNINY